MATERFNGGNTGHIQCQRWLREQWRQQAPLAVFSNSMENFDGDGGSDGWV